MTYFEFELACILPFGNAAYIHSDLMLQHVSGSVILAIIFLQEHEYVFLFCIFLHSVVKLNTTFLHMYAGNL